MKIQVEQTRPFFSPTTLTILFIILVTSEWTFAQEALPPILLTPYNETNVSDRFVTWSWFMQPKASTGENVVCDLRVVEILSDQTPEEAVRVNPPVLERNDLRSSVWQASLGTRSLIQGHRYAWQITARAADKIVGTSEIWAFIYTEPQVEDTTVTYKKAPDEPPPQKDEDSQLRQSAQPQRRGSISANIDTRVTIESSNKPGELSEAPKNFTRWELNPTITINGAPLQLSFLITTEQNSSASTVNRGAFMYRRDAGGLQLGIEQRVGEKVEELKQTKLDMMRDSLRQFRSDTLELDRQIEELRALHSKDPRETAKTLEEFGIAAGTDPLFLDIPSFGFGAVAPQFTNLTLSSVTINGGLVEYNPGNLYLAGAVGKGPREIDLSSVSLSSLGNEGSTVTPQFFHNVYAARIGYGRKEKNNVILSILYSRDDEQSRFVESLLDTTSTIFAPQENFLLGLSGQLRSDEMGLTLDGEVNTTLFTERVSGSKPREGRLRILAARVFGASNMSEQSIGDIAYAGRVQQLLFRRNGKLTADVRMVGPSYRTIGIVGLRTDIFGYDTRYEHNLIGNTLTVSGLFGFEETGFIVKDPGISKLTKYGVNTELRLPNMPSVQLGYTNNTQEQTLAADSSHRKTVVHLLTASSRHLARLGGIRMASFVSYSLQNALSTDHLSDSRTTTLLFNTRISLASPISAILTFSHSKTTSAADTADRQAVVSGDISFLYDALGVWQNVIGATYSTNQQSRTRGAVLSSRVDISSFGVTELRWEYTEFTSSLVDTKNFFDRTLRLLIRLQF